MQEEAPLKDRKVIPRWREFLRTPAHELGPMAGSSPAIDLVADTLSSVLKQWESQQDLENAAEVLDASFVALNPERAEYIAKRILAPGSAATPALRTLASRVARPTEPRPDPSISVYAENPTDRLAAIHNRIRELRRLGSANPADALTWLEIARLQTSIAQIDSARRAMKLAIGAAPNSRLVLRAASRFFVHSNDPEQGYSLLLRSQILRNDPWVQAAEISLARLAGRTPRSVRAGRDRIETARTNFVHISDLAAAIATEELMNGEVRRARRHFLLSLRNPTDNALAQALWIRSQLKLDFSVNIGSVMNAHEALFRLASDRGDFAAAFRHCFEWLDDEPYSARPAINGSFLAAEFLQNSRRALLVAQRGLVANPDDITLNNNAVVALCRIGRTEEARLRFERHLVGNNDPAHVAILQATAGLLAFSQGKPLEGRALYSHAAKSASKDRRIDIAVRAIIYWLEQEIVNKLVPIRHAGVVFDALEKIMKRHGKTIQSITWHVWRTKLPSMKSCLNDQLSGNLSSIGSQTNDEVVAQFLEPLKENGIAE